MDCAGASPSYGGLMSPSASSVGFEADAMQLCNKGK